MSRARYRCNFQCKHFPQAVTKPLKLDLRSKSAPIMKQTESIGAFFYFFYFLWLAFRPTQGGLRKSLFRSWMSETVDHLFPSSHHPFHSRFSLHPLFFFNPNSLFCRPREEKSIQGKMWKLLDVSKQRHECGFWQEDGCPVKQTKQNAVDF